MPMSSAKRALIAVAILILLAVTAGSFYLYRMHRPLSPASAGKPPDILSLLPSDSPIIIYIDADALRGLQGSPLVAGLGLAGPNPQQDRDYLQFVQSTGFDYTRDLDHAAIAFWPAGLATPANPMGDDRSLIYADGHFDQQRIAAYALRTGHLETRGSQSIYRVPGNPPIAFTFLSPDRIELASGKNAEALLAPPAAQPRDPAMQTRLNRVAGAPVFAVARLDTLPDSFYANFRNAPQLDHFVRSIRALSLAGKPQGDLFQLALDADCDSLKNAFEISALLETFRMVGSMALSDPHTRSQMTPEQYAFARSFLKQLRISNQDHWVRLSIDITPEMLRAAAASPGSHASAGR
jgi:hypothetical protein